MNSVEGLFAIGHLLFLLGLLLGVTRVCGRAAERVGQPGVIGEIVGGLMLGPTLLGAVAPELHHMLWRASSFRVLDALGQSGLLLLMFCSGMELRTHFSGSERRTALAVTTSGAIFPFVSVLAMRGWLDAAGNMGPAQNEAAFHLIAAIAVAVTSIPVISRILLDLGLMDTAFAGIVVSAAVIEDTVLYVILAVALALAEPTGGLSYGALATHAVATPIFFVSSVSVGVWALGRGRRLARTAPDPRVPGVAWLLVAALAGCVLAWGVGVAPFLGAFAAGIVANRGLPEQVKLGRLPLRRLAFGSVVPLYFVLVGARLDLVRHFDLRWFLAFCSFACAIKLGSVYLGARLARERPWASLNLAVAMNARGGPGIVLASVSFAAGIINEGFYAVLVMLALVTSSAAGAWLGWVSRSGRALR